MRHLKIYEEYSDEELHDLIGNLSDIGHKNRLVQGEDFGFGPDLKGENNGKNILFLTQEAVNDLKKTTFFHEYQYSPRNKNSVENIAWHSWPEYNKAYDNSIPVPELIKSEELKSIEYPPTRGFGLGFGPYPVNDMWFIGLSATRSGRSFPLNSFDAKNMFVSSKKVAPIYDLIVDKIKNVNI